MISYIICIVVGAVIGSAITAPVNRNGNPFGYDENPCRLCKYRLNADKGNQPD